MTIKLKKNIDNSNNDDNNDNNNINIDSKK